MASACELLLRFARPSARLEGRDVELVEKICVLSEDFLQREARSFIVENSDKTLLLWCACDSTPLKVRRSHRRKVNLLEVHRSCKGCVDYLVQRCYIQNNTGATKALFTEPLPLGNKTAWAHVQGYRQLVPNLRAAGHRGLHLIHFVSDRALYTACGRKIQQVLVFEERAREQDNDPSEAAALSLTSFFPRAGASTTTHTAATRRASPSTSTARRRYGAPTSCLKAYGTASARWSRT